MDSANSIANQLSRAREQAVFAQSRDREGVIPALARTRGSVEPIAGSANGASPYQSFGVRCSMFDVRCSMFSPRTAAIVPCFNEAQTIGPLVLRLRQYLNLIVVVDDGSTDNTALEAERAGATVLRHDRNRGKGAALQTGLSHLHHLGCGCDWAVTLDGDGQHDPADLPALLHCAEQTGASLVIGNRIGNADAMPWLRRFVNRWMSKKLSIYSGHHLPDTQSGYRLIHLQTWLELRLSAQRFEVESEMLVAFLSAGHSVEFAPIRAIPAARKSRIRPLADTVRWFKWWGGLHRGHKVAERQWRVARHGVSGTQQKINLS